MVERVSKRQVSQTPGGEDKKGGVKHPERGMFKMKVTKDKEISKRYGTKQA